MGHESLSSPSYASYLDLFVKKCVLKRIVIDEAHLIPLLTSFRQSMFSVYGTSRGGTVCQVVMLTAAAPTFLVTDIIQHCGFSVRSVKIIHSRSLSTNLGITVAYLSDGPDSTLFNKILAFIVRILEGNHEGLRMILYCPTVRQVEEVWDYVSLRCRAHPDKMKGTKLYNTMANQERKDKFSCHCGIIEVMQWL